MSNLIIQLFGIFAPIFTSLIQRYMTDHGGELPTDDELKALFAANLDHYLTEISEWKTAHPESDTTNG